MIARIVKALAFGALYCGVSAAGEPDFSFVEAAYLKPDEGSRGASLRGSGRIGDQWLMRGNVDVFERFNGDALTASLGFGGHWRQQSPLQISLVVSLELMAGDFEDDDGGGASGGSLGAGAGLGVHYRAGRMELQGVATYESVTNDVRLFGDASYYFLENFAAGLDVTDDVLGTRVGVALRYAF